MIPRLLQCIVSAVFPDTWLVEYEHAVRMYKDGGLTVVIDDDTGQVTFLSGIHPDTGLPGRVVIFKP